MGLLRTTKASVSYDSSTFAIKEVNLSVNQGGLLVLLGKSGSGKSTLLRSLAGLQSLTEGKVMMEGKDVAELSATERAQNIAFVAQDYHLFPHMTVIENCTHPQEKVLGVDAKEAQLCAEGLLEQLQIQSLAQRYPHQLSGGQKQRVAIARSLAMGSKVLLLDEPTAALDPHSTEVLAKLLKKLSQEGFTIILSTHDMDFTAEVIGAVAILQGGHLSAYYPGGEEEVPSMETLKLHMIEEKK